MDRNEVRLHFSVSDTGIGIPSDKLTTIFSAFEQADGSTTRKYGGTGLGLAISSQLVELMNGRLSVDSEVGRGSKFHFTAMFGVSESVVPDNASLNTSEIQNARILVADDNATSRDILEQMLTGWGTRPLLVSNAQSALDALRKAKQAGEPFELIVLDSLLAGISGVQVAEELSRGIDIAQTPIILLTTADSQDQRLLSDGIHISSRVSKPVRQSELFNSILSALCGDSPVQLQPETASVVQSCATSRALEILLAEDNPINQKLATTLLKKQGHHVTVAGDGMTVLEELEQHHYDIVLMDVQMPIMDGLEATALIRKREKNTGRHIPIIAMTAHAMKGDQERCIEAGMDSYISKPIHADQLFSTIESFNISENNRQPNQEAA